MPCACGVALTGGRRFCPFDAPESWGGHTTQDVRLGFELRCAESVPSLPISLSGCFGWQ
jgi:hypothetical protein